MATLTGETDPVDAASSDQVTKAQSRIRVLQPFVPRHLTQGYSRFVSMMKFLLPAVAVIVIALVVLWPHLGADDLKFRLGFAAVKLGISEEPSMVNPRYIGADKENQPYSVTADLARRITGGNFLKGAEAVELEMPKADIMMKDGTWVVLTAKTGVFARGNQTLGLKGAVNLFHDSGYEFRTEVAEIDLAAGAAEGTAPIEGQGPFGNLKAEGFKLINRGKIIYFTGKSKLVLFPGAGKTLK